MTGYSPDPEDLGGRIAPIADRSRRGRVDKGADLGLTHQARFLRWDGQQVVPDLDADEILGALADDVMAEGDVAEAERRYRLSLDAAWETGDLVETCYELQGMAMAAAGSGDAARALTLASAASSNLGKLGVEGIPPFWSGLIDRHVAMARAQLGEEASDLAWADGSSMSLSDAVTLALRRKAPGG